MSQTIAGDGEVRGPVGPGSSEQQRGGATSLMPVVRVAIMSWCFQFLLDLLWIPLAAKFHDEGLRLHVLGMVFAVNLGVRLVPNVLATRAGVKTDMVCMVCGLLCFMVNFVFPDDTWAIIVMAAGGGMTFVRAHLSVHGKLAAGGSKENLSLAAKWSGAARNLGTVVAFVVPVVVYRHFGWPAVVGSGMAAMLGYLALAAVQHAYVGLHPTDVDELSEGLVEQAPATGSISQIPWIDWIMAAAFCITELQMNVQAAAVPTTLMRQFELPVYFCGPVQALGQLIAMGFLVLLSKGYGGVFQKRPLNMIVAFFGTFLGMSVLCWSTALDGERAAQIIFILSLYFFYIMAYTAQVTMLECLTGVLDMQNAIVVIGISEMIGCACSLFGGYLGPVLLEVDPCAPFVLQMVIALATTLMVAFCLGHRAVSQMLVVCETQEQYLASVQDADIEQPVERRPSVVNSLKGLKHMKKRRDSYIGIEKRYRKRTASSNSLASMGSCNSLASMASSVADDTPRSLTQALLATPTTADTGADAGVAAASHAEIFTRAQSKEVPVPDVVTSTFSGRQLKKAMACFDRAYVDIDTEDHEVNRVAVQSLMMRQPSHEGHPVGVYAGA